MQVGACSPCSYTPSFLLTMKKTLIIALFMALAPCALAAADFTTTNSIDNTSGGNSYFRGFRLLLDSSVTATRVTTSSTDTPLAITDWDRVSLDSVTVKIRTLNSASGLRLVVTDENRRVLSLSENVVTNTGDAGTVTWTFAGTDVSTTDQIYFYYVKSDASVSVGGTLDVNDTVTAGTIGAVSYANDPGQSGVNSLVILGNNNLVDLGPMTSTNYAPHLTVTTSTLYAIWISSDGSWNVDEGEALMLDGRGSSTVTVSASGAETEWLEVDTENHDVKKYTLTGGELTTGRLQVIEGELEVGNRTVVSGETIVESTGTLTITAGGELETGSLGIYLDGENAGVTPTLALAGQLTVTGEASETASEVYGISGVNGTYGQLTIQNEGYTVRALSDVALRSLAGGGELDATGHSVTLQGRSDGGTDLKASSLALGSAGNVLGTVVTDSITLSASALQSSSAILAVDSLSSGSAGSAITLTMDPNQVTQSLADSLAGETRTVITGSLTSNVTLDSRVVDLFAAYDVDVTGSWTGSSYTLTFTKHDIPPYASPWDELKSYGGNAAAGAIQMEAVSDALDTGLIAADDRPDTVAALGALEDAFNAGNMASAGKIASAVAGASVATLGAAYTADVERQLRAIRNRTTAMGLAPCEVHEDLPYYNAWINAEGDYRKLDEDGTLSGYKLESWGGTVGFDVDVNPSTVLGMALTAMYGDLETTSADRAKGDLDRYYLSAFARVTSRAWVHTFVATGGLADITLDRTVSLGSGYDYKTHGTTDGYAIGFLYELAYTIQANEDATVCWQPLVNVSYRYTSVDGYRESGSDAALTVDKQDSSVLTFGAGLRLQAAIGENVYNRSSLFELRALVKVDAGDREGAADVSLLPGVVSRVKSTEVSAVGAELGAGLTIPVGADEGALFFDASAELRSEYTAVNGTVGYRMNF